MNESTKRKPASFDDDIKLQIGEGGESGLVDFITKRLSQLHAMVMILQSDLHLENDGGSSVGIGTRLDTIWTILDHVQQIKAAFREYYTGGAS